MTEPTSWFPFNPNYYYSYSQQLFEYTELGIAKGMIKSISFQYVREDTIVRHNQKIYLGRTLKTEFMSAYDWVPFSELTEVFSGTIIYSGKNDWITINFDTPFIYNYEDGSIVVAYLDNDATYYISDNAFYAAYTGENKTISFSDDFPIDPSMPPPTELHYSRNNVKFEICPYHSIWGYVNKEDLTPVPNISVSLYRITDGRYPVVETVTTNTYGYFSFDIVNKGDYLVKANPGNCNFGLPTYYGDLLNWESATVLSVVGEDVVNVVIKLVPCLPLNGTSTISGHVYVDDGSKGLEPAEGVDVCIIKTVDITKATVSGTTTNSAGYFGFTNVPAGNYTVMIDVPGVPTPDYSIGEVEEGEDITDVVLIIDGENSIPKRENKDLSILVYPNPTTGELTMDNEQLTIRSMELYDVTGKKQFSILNCQLSIEKIDISNLAKGIYFLKITTEKGVVAKKVIKY